MYILQLRYQQIKQSSLHSSLTILNTQLSIVTNCPGLYLLRVPDVFRMFFFFEFIHTTLQLIRPL